MQYVYALEGINPEPWAIGKAFAMRGLARAGIAPNRKLVAFQQAAREALLAEYDPPLLTCPIKMHFFFSRAVEKTSYGDKSAHAMHADATNLQKALEDAFQGILYKNDNQVIDIHSSIVDQSTTAEPGIAIVVSDSVDLVKIRTQWMQILNTKEREEGIKSNVW